MSHRTGLLLVVALAFACAADDAPEAPQTRAPRGPLVQQPAPATASAPSASPDFAFDERELQTLRDPFQSTDDAVVPPVDRDAVAFSDTPVRALKVSGTVAGVGEGKAIIANAAGETRVLAVGERLGQLEKTADGGSAEWRIDSVRDGRVFLLRQGGTASVALVLGEAANPSGRKRSASTVSDRPLRR